MKLVPARPWTWFRGLARTLQLTIGLVVAVVLVSPFTSDGHRTVAADRPPATVGPTTAGEAIVEVPTTNAATTTVVPTTAPALPAGLPSSGDDTTLVRVIDGDTIEVAGGTRVRLIGIDTPETVDPSSPIECFGPEATRFVRELLPVGTRLRLFYDVDRLDRYGRTLAYVYRLSDGVFVNLAIARDGFASQLTVPANVAHTEELGAAVAAARRANLGLWRACGSTTTAAPTTSAPRTPPPTAGAPTTGAPTTRVTPAPTPTTATPGGECHPSYAGGCVPTGFSDVDCAGGSGNGPGYVSSKNFRVVGPDVYDLDADGDGIGCESR